MPDTFGEMLCCIAALCALSAPGAPAQTLTTLFSFDFANGDYPQGVLVQAADGNLDGTTSGGGRYGDGTIFEITPRGLLTTLASFNFVAYADGVLQATDGDLYGTTYYGGVEGVGTVFKGTPSATVTTLYNFCTEGNCGGAWPHAGLIQAPTGEFYGTASGGGAYNGGTVFEIARTGALATLYSFCAQSYCPDGASPFGALVQASNGELYGTTYSGGLGYGTVFKLARDATLMKLTTLHQFHGPPDDGVWPWAGLAQATDGDFYGTTLGGGVYFQGTVFKITPNGNLTVLYSFCAQANCKDGSYPQGALIQGSDGNLYGTTANGGAHGYGTIFKLSLNGVLKTLYSFCAQENCGDGSNPMTALVQHTSGVLFGTTPSGGAYGNGTVFSLSVGLGPFVKTLPTAGKVGTHVIILGSGLTGTTAVSFNGAAAAFTVLSDSEVSTAVPTSASSGKIQVATPGGALSSIVAFHVIP